MQLVEIAQRYSLCDGSILSLQLDYRSSQMSVALQVRRWMAKQKFEPCEVKFEFKEVKEFFVFEDFECGSYSDITLVEIKGGDFYLSLDPFDNSAKPSDEDNFVIVAGVMTLIDEKGVRHEIVN